MMVTESEHLTRSLEPFVTKHKQLVVHNCSECLLMCSWYHIVVTT